MILQQLRPRGSSSAAFATWALVHCSLRPYGRTQHLDGQPTVEDPDPVLSAQPDMRAREGPPQTTSTDTVKADLQRHELFVSSGTASWLATLQRVGVSWNPSSGGYALPYIISRLYQAGGVT